MQSRLGDAAVFPCEGEQQVLAANDLAGKVSSFFNRDGHDISKMRRAGQPAEDPGVFEAGFDESIDGGLGLGEVNAEFLEDFRADAGAFFEDGQQQVLGSDVILLVVASDSLRESDDGLHSAGEFLVHGVPESYQRFVGVDSAEFGATAAGGESLIGPGSVRSASHL